MRKRPQLANPLLLGLDANGRSSRLLKTGRHSAFTLAELLFVLVMLAHLTFTLLPALARTKGDSRAFQCLNNAHELNRA
jgi:type II secretory pathway pseudopilin PulG